MLFARQRGKLPLHRKRCDRSLWGVRTNPTPAEGVAAWYEDKETALSKSREAGGASRCPRDPKEAKDPPPQSKPR
jgi:hypothetical protein